MEFWTKDEFQEFIKYVTKTHISIGLKVLYWTGIRIGELLALTLADIDFENKTIRINKPYIRIVKQDIITEPKTPKCNRVIMMPDFLCNELQEYVKSLYCIKSTERLFFFSYDIFKREMKIGIDKAGVKKIRIHDLRHSHASLLIELGFSPLLIAERLGHESIETTPETYSHLYPNKQAELIEKLENIK